MSIYKYTLSAVNTWGLVFGRIGGGIGRGAEEEVGDGAGWADKAERG